MPLSTRDLSLLPNPAQLEKLTRSLAMLDAIMSPEWKYRYFLFDPLWDVSKNERMAKMNNGSGDEYYIVFCETGVFIKGFDHECDFSPWSVDPMKVREGVLDQVPDSFQAQLVEPSFDMESTTFCIWRKTADAEWHRGLIDFPAIDDPDGSENLLWMLDGNPATYIAFAKEYYEQDIDTEIVNSIYEFSPLSSAWVSSLNPGASWEEVMNEALLLDYPIATADSIGKAGFHL